MFSSHAEIIASVVHIKPSTCFNGPMDKNAVFVSYDDLNVSWMDRVDLFSCYACNVLPELQLSWLEPNSFCSTDSLPMVPPVSASASSCSSGSGGAATVSSNDGFTEITGPQNSDDDVSGDITLRYHCEKLGNQTFYKKMGEKCIDVPLQHNGEPAFFSHLPRIDEIIHALHTIASSSRSVTFPTPPGAKKNVKKISSAPDAQSIILCETAEEQQKSYKNESHAICTENDESKIGCTDGTSAETKEKEKTKTGGTIEQQRLVNALFFAHRQLKRTRVDMEQSQKKLCKDLFCNVSCIVTETKDPSSEKRIRLQLTQQLNHQATVKNSIIPSLFALMDLLNETGHLSYAF
jgi:hypothetical protein